MINWRGIAQHYHQLVEWDMNYVETLRLMRVEERSSTSRLVDMTSLRMCRVTNMVRRSFPYYRPNAHLLWRVGPHELMAQVRGWPAI